MLHSVSWFALLCLLAQLLTCLTLLGGEIAVLSGGEEALSYGASLSERE